MLIVPCSRQVVPFCLLPARPLHNTFLCRGATSTPKLSLSKRPGSCHLLGPSRRSWAVSSIGGLIGRCYSPIHCIVNFTLPLRSGRVEGEVRAFGEGGWRLDRCSNHPPRKLANARFRPSRRREGEVPLASFASLGGANVAINRSLNETRSTATMCVSNVLLPLAEFQPSSDAHSLPWTRSTQ